MLQDRPQRNYLLDLYAAACLLGRRTRIDRRMWDGRRARYPTQLQLRRVRMPGMVASSGRKAGQSCRRMNRKTRCIAVCLRQDVVARRSDHRRAYYSVCTVRICLAEAGRTCCCQASSCWASEGSHGGCSAFWSAHGHPLASCTLWSAAPSAYCEQGLNSSAAADSWCAIATRQRLD